MDNQPPVPNVPPKPPVVPIAPQTTPVPNVSTSAPEHQHHSLLPVLLILLVVALGYFWFQNFMDKGAAAYAPTAAVVTSTAVAFTTPAPGVSVVQGGFPTSQFAVVPANGTVTSNYTATYANHSATQYTLTLTTSTTVSDLQAQYSALLSKNGFALGTSTSGTVSGTKNNQTLCFIISSNGNISSVQINLLVKGQ